jgi:hypothetical protein
LVVSVQHLRTFSLFVSLVYCAESTVRWFIVREKHCWIAADSADKSKRTGHSSLPPKPDRSGRMRDEVVTAENAGRDHGFMRCGSAKDQPSVHQVASTTVMMCCKELIDNTRA